MHDLQLLFSRLTIGDDLMNCDEPQLSPFPLSPPVVNPGLFIVPQLPDLFFTGLVNQGMVQEAPSLGQYPSRAPSWGPSRHQRHAGSIGSREAEALYQNNITHELSGTITRDRSTGTHPGMARMDDDNNAGAEKVWRTPSRNP